MEFFLPIKYVIDFICVFLKFPNTKWFFSKLILKIAYRRSFWDKGTIWLNNNERKGLQIEAKKQFVKHIWRRIPNSRIEKVKLIFENLQKCVKYEHLELNKEENIDTSDVIARYDYIQITYKTLFIKKKTGKNLQMFINSSFFNQLNFQIFLWYQVYFYDFKGNVENLTFRNHPTSFLTSVFEEKLISD